VQELRGVRKKAVIRPMLAKGGHDNILKEQVYEDCSEAGAFAALRTWTAARQSGG